MKYCKINDLAMAHNMLNVTFYGTSDANCVTLEDTYIICHIAAASAYPLAAASAYPLAAASAYPLAAAMLADGLTLCRQGQGRGQPT